MSSPSTFGKLEPIVNLDPFPCYILPTAAAFASCAPSDHTVPAPQQCLQGKFLRADIAPPDCSRLPPAYQGFCVSNLAAQAQANRNQQCNWNVNTGAGSQKIIFFHQ